jgi:hypothetical protein
MWGPTAGCALNDQVCLDKNAKLHKINYEKRNEHIDYNVIKVGLNNDTRISGYVRTYQQALRYVVSARCINISLMRSSWFATPMRCRMNIGNLWSRSKPSFNESAPCHSQCRSTYESLPTPTDPMSSDQDYYQGDDLFGSRHHAVVSF